MRNTVQLLISEKPSADNTTKVNVNVSQFIFTNQSLLGGGNCNFIHPKHIAAQFKQELQDQMYLEYPEYKEAKKLRIEQGLEDEDDYYKNNER